MVPGSFGCGSAVLAAMTMLAPSLAAFRAMLLPIPLEAPVMKIVHPASFLFDEESIWNVRNSYVRFVDTIVNHS